jgi:iron-sulfur cluster assembly protein
MKSFNAAEITLTQPAANRLQAVMKGENKEDFALRLEVVGGGCSGMSYKMSFEDQQREFDKVFESQGMKIFCDLQSWLYLKGIEIDCSDDLLTGGFKIKNPNAQRTCGCGTSFSA